MFTLPSCVKVSFTILLGNICLLASGQTPVSNKPLSNAQVPVPVNPAATTPTAYPVGTKINYVRTREALGRIPDEATFNSATYLDVKESTLYLDGLGRPLQTVSRQATPGSTPKDVVA